MEISEKLASYLKSLEINGPVQGENGWKIEEKDFESFESGQQIVKILKQLPLPEALSSLDLLKNLKSNSAKLYNWKIIFKTLQSLNIDVNQDIQQQILNGDSDFIVKLLGKIMKRHKKLSTPSRFKSKRPRMAPDGALYIESIDPKRDLMQTNSCLEFLILSFCQSFLIAPKQAAGLLTQGNKFLAHIIVKGLKGNHEKVQDWYSVFIGKFSKLKQLIEVELAKGSLQLILNAVKPGLLCKQQKTVEKCAEVLKIIFSEIHSEEVLWEWLKTDTIELCAISLKRSDEATAKFFSKIFLPLKNNHLFDLINEKLKVFLDNSEFLTILLKLYSGFFEEKNKFKESGLVDFYLHFALSSVEVNKILDNKGKNSYCLKKLSLLFCLWRDFSEDVCESENEIMLEAKRIMKDCSVDTKIFILGQFFGMVNGFYLDKCKSAAVILKTLIFALIENYENEVLREFVLQNFIILIDSIESLPICSILDPLLKQIQYFQSIRFNVVDHEFFLTAARHPRVSLENLIIILDVLCKAFLEDLLYSKACQYTILYIIGTYFEKTPVAEYIFKFCDLSFSLISTLAAEKFMKPEKKGATQGNKNVVNSEVEANINSAHRRNLIFDIFNKLIKLKNPYLNEHIQKQALEHNWNVKRSTKENNKGFESLLNMLGDADELIKSFEIRAIVPYQEPLKTESNFQAYRPPAITGRAAEDIERIKNQRKLAIEKKVKLEEEQKKKQQKLLENALKDLESNKSKQEMVGILDKSGLITSIDQTFEYFDLSVEPKNEVDLIEKISKRYALPLKLLFIKYCKPPIKKQSPDLESFDENILTESQLLNLLKGEFIIPQKLKRDEALSIIKETYRRESNSTNPVKFTRKSFQLVLFQLSANLFKSDDQFNVTPLALRYWEFIKLLRKSEKNQKIYDEPDPGTADREVTNFLNEKLKINPNFPLPPSIFKCTEYEFEIVYKPPKGFKTPHRVALEVIDELLFSGLNLHFLRPVFKAIPVTVAKGSNISENPSVAILPIYLSVSPDMKYNILKLSEKFHLDTLIDAGKVLEELLVSVSTGKDKFGIFTGFTKNSYLKQKEIENYEIEQKRAKAEALRKQRKQQLDEYLKQKKVENENKELAEAKEKEEKIQMENKKIAEVQEKRQKDLQDKKKMVEEWKTRKTEEENEIKVKKEKKIEKMKPTKSISHSILPLLNRKVSTIKKNKKPEKNSINPSTPKLKSSNLTFAKALSGSKKIIESEQKRKEQFFQFFANGSVKSAISEYSKALNSVFSQYLKQTMSPTEIEFGLNLKGLNKLCLDFSIQPSLVTSSFMANSFNRITKEKQKFLDFNDFTEILSEISFNSTDPLKEYVKDPEDPGEIFRSLLRFMKINPEQKPSTKPKRLG